MTRAGESPVLKCGEWRSVGNTGNFLLWRLRINKLIRVQIPASPPLFSAASLVILGGSFLFPKTFFIFNLTNTQTCVMLCYE